jgi:hypothetical protein
VKAESSRANDEFAARGRVGHFWFSVPCHVALRHAGLPKP